nr:uncharacterized protein LOC116767740 [Danaus plexippus plexippus]
MTALIEESRLTLEQRVNLWKGTLENGGLKLNVTKTEYMACGSPDSCTNHIGPEPSVKSEKFRYLGSILHESGSIDHDVQARISAAWAKWREVTALSRHTQELHEMKMLRWMCGGTRADCIHNTFMRGSIGVRDVVDKLQESRLRCKTPRAPKEAMAGHREAGYESQWTYHRGCQTPCKVEEFKQEGRPWLKLG